MKLIALSSDARHVITEISSHIIDEYGPRLVIEEIILLILCVMALGSFGYYHHLQAINDLEEEVRTILQSRDAENDLLALQVAEKDADRFIVQEHDHDRTGNQRGDVQESS